MPTVAQLTWTQTRTIPIWGWGKQMNVPLAPGTYLQGQVIGQITGTNTNDVQTITVSSSTHSTLTLTNLPGGLSYVAVQDITPAALQTALNALLGANAYAVTGTYVAGSGGTYILTAGTTGPYAYQPLSLVGVSATFVGGSSPTAVPVHTTVGIGPNNSFGLYASGHTDGTQLCIGILEYPCVATSTGLIYLGTQASSEFGQYNITMPMWYKGDFSLVDINGLDANAVTVLGAKFLSGGITATTGVLHLP